MIKIDGQNSVEKVFDAQQLATLKGFGDALLFDGSVCQSTIESDENPIGEFFCTRIDGHPGPHVAMGLEVMSVWESE